MVDIKRKKGETFESMLRRFSKRLMQSKKLLMVKKQQYVQTEESRNMRRKNTLERLKRGKQKEYLRKTGKLKEEELYPRKRKY